MRTFMALQDPELQALQQQLQQLTDLRRQIDQFAITNTDSAERYTQFITQMIALNHQLEQQLVHQQMARQLATLNQFSEMKERAGRERAILGLVFSRDSFTPELLSRYSNNLGAFHAFAANFERMADEPISQQWQALQRQPVFSEVARLQQLGFNVPPGQSLQVNDGDWFEVSSSRIAQLAEFERSLNLQLLQSAELVQQRTLWTLLGLIMALLLVFSLVIVVTAMIMRRIRFAAQDIDGTVATLAQRDLTVRCNYSAKDEFGRIAQSVNQMSSELAQVVREIGEAASQIATTAEQASAVTQETSQGVRQQQQDTELAATAMHEMSTTVRDVASSTAEAAELSAKVQLDAASGLQKLQTTIQLIKALSVQVDQTSTIIDKVKQESDSISSVLDVIRSIADQTNLLALNAAIEAARAGDQGRGFAVVADEVRTLAQRTATSTGDIQRMIESLQQGSEQAAQAMQQSLQQASEGASIVVETGDILQQLLSGIDGMNDKNIQIASAAEQQSTVAEDINEKIIRISDVATQTSSGASQTAAASQDLAKLAEQLAGLVQRFRLA
ncbi:methyl-accepting chemotaxis protein [Alkalimonas sp. NCh-2]|uniref:methyl-accepting chemotaxis protein n=1 Tax=Alkalimonas sp. NCh-2 TaxID=3144846 RepID=UPI0031F6DF6D